MDEIAVEDGLGVRLQIAAIGAVFDEAVLVATRKLYRPSVERQSTSGISIRTDISYGVDPRHQLDLFRPDRGRRLPMLAYFHGGGFTSGDKNGDGVFYRNVGVYFARHKFVTAVCNYRLAPAHRWPAGSEDVSAVVHWMASNADELGGDPTKLFLVGQSAGATHVATYLFHPALHPTGSATVAAAVLMSGVYRFAGALAPNVAAYFGADADEYEDRSPLTHVASNSVPLLLTVAEYDPSHLAAPTFESAHAATLRDGRAPQVAWFAGHNHVSTVHSLGSAQDDVGARIRDFLHAFGSTS